MKTRAYLIAANISPAVDPSVAVDLVEPPRPGSEAHR